MTTENQNQTETAEVSRFQTVKQSAGRLGRAAGRGVETGVEVGTAVLIVGAAFLVVVAAINALAPEEDQSSSAPAPAPTA